MFFQVLSGGFNLQCNFSGNLYPYFLSILQKLTFSFFQSPCQWGKTSPKTGCPEYDNELYLLKRLKILRSVE